MVSVTKIIRINGNKTDENNKTHDNTEKSLITIMVQVLTVVILETTHINNLVVGIPTPLKNMSSSVRMMTFPI